ncbi:hypothetical protein Golax_022675 [Gossypium laxum]|uniref:Uncharacterized protein n=1 Tax=Gossypium laxum TaxID=34288 RepID=A0A7J9B359_9ROSI|nr:hypothetical protein [Gossypium laxum]
MHDSLPNNKGNNRHLISGQIQVEPQFSLHKKVDHVVHFNPTFEDNSFVNVEVNEGVLEAKNHSAVAFTNKSLLVIVNEELGVVNRLELICLGRFLRDRMLKGLVQNEGYASDKFLRAFREYNNQHRPDIVSLLEPRICGNKVNIIIATLGWDKSHHVEAVGFSRGIWIGLKNSIDLKVVGNHPQFILACICSNLHPKPIFVAFVYWSPDKMKMKILWNDLSSSIPLGDAYWMAIGDFNAIFSLAERKCGHIEGNIC